MNHFFESFFVHPNTKEPLTLNSNTITLDTAKGESFRIKKGVPLLLPTQQSNDAQFDYQAHYEQDAIAFDYFENFIESHHLENERLHEHILATIPADASLILDVGCGGAWLAKTLIPKGKKVISMDISTTNPIRAMQVVPSENHQGLVADVFSLPIAPNSVDCIVAAEIIEHVKDPQLFIANLFEVLKPGGTLIITTPFKELLQQSLCIHCNQLTPHNAHLHSFTQESIKSIAPHQATAVQTQIFNSKLLIITQTHIRLKNWSFKAWKTLDKWAVKLTGNRAERLMLIVKK